MKTWLVVRLALVVGSFLQGWLLDPPLTSAEEVSWPELLFVFGFGIVGIPFVVGLQRFNPRSAPTWRYPSWYINPFLAREPLQFFHLSAFVLFAVAAGDVLRSLSLGRSLQLSNFLPLAFGASVLVGVHACTWMFRGKMSRSHFERTRDDARR